MGQGYLIDTNAVIDFLIGKLPVAARQKMMNIEPVISVITQIELFSSSKTPSVELLHIQAFVNDAIVYNVIDEQIVQHAINIRKQHKIKTPDAIIAATALVYNLILLTRNTTDFNKIPGLNLTNPWDMQ